MAIADTLVTRYTMDESDYKRGASGVTSATSSMIGQFQLGIGLAKGFATAIAAGVGAVVAGAGMAVKSASDWEVLNAQLAVVTGSFERAAEISKFADQLALPSAFFDTAQLAETAKLLETMQLQTERYLPIVSTMASLFGASTESLMGFASALGRIKAGSFGEGFERMREFGIAAKDLAAEGVTFKNGQFQLLDGEDAVAGADRALAAVEAVVKKRFGNMDAIMGDTMSARFATLGETISKAFRIAGESLNKQLKGPFDSFVTGFSNFVQGPQFKELADKFTSIVNFDAIKSSAISFFAGIVAGFMQLPKMIKGVQDQLQLMWKVATQAAIVYLSVQAGIISAQIIQGIVGIARAFITVAGAAAAAAASAATFETLLGGIGVVVAGLLVGTAVFVGLQKLIESQTPGDMTPPGFDVQQWKADRDKIEKDMNSAPMGQPAGNPAEEARKAALAAAEAKKQKDADAGQQADTELNKQTGYLAAIERNTSPERNQILGGGSIGAKGITPQELGAAGRGRGKLDMAVRLIAEWAGEAQAKSGADFLKMANPFIGGR